MSHYSESIGFHSADLHCIAIDVPYFFHGPLMIDRWPESPEWIGYYVPWTWRLCIVHHSGVDAFMRIDVIGNNAWAVMDDFGNLVRVQ